MGPRLGVVTKRREPGRNAGTFGWDGAFGTSFWVDPREGVVGVLMTQRRPDWMTAFELPAVVRDFWTTAYQAIDD